MGSLLTTEKFVEKAKLVHGERYNYDKVVYTGTYNKIEITCNVCGTTFPQEPNSHLNGCGCPVCKINGHKNIICGVGVNDMLGESKTVAYQIWIGMIKRCYSSEVQERQPTYKGCSVCEEWLRFSNFKNWYDKNHVEDYHLDKDILVKGNKVYSPETCCFVPSEINTLFTKSNAKRGNLPIGVRKCKRKFMTMCKLGGVVTYLGLYNTIEEAFNAYKQSKEAHIKEVAQKYFDDGKITKRVYDALMRYEVEITD